MRDFYPPAQQCAVFAAHVASRPFWGGGVFIFISFIHRFPPLLSFVALVIGVSSCPIAHATCDGMATFRLQASTLAPTASPSPAGSRSCAQLGWVPARVTPLVCAESAINGVCRQDKAYAEVLLARA